MGVVARCEVDAADVLARNVLSIVDREAETKSGKQRALVVGESIERLGAIGNVVIQPADQVIFNEWLAEARSQGGKWRPSQIDRSQRGLLRALAVAKEEQLVLEYRTTEAGTVLVALGIQVLATDGGRRQRVIAEKTECLAVQRVGPRAGRNVDCSRRGQVL